MNTEQLHAEFEAAMDGLRFDRSDDGTYTSSVTRVALEAYQAGRAALQSHDSEVWLNRLISLAVSYGDSRHFEVEADDKRDAACRSAQAFKNLIDHARALQSQDREDAEVTAYALPGGISVERSMQRDGTYLWAVRDSFKQCLSKSGEWDYEPFPSSRTEEWLDQHRFSSAREAIDHARRVEGGWGMNPNYLRVGDEVKDSPIGPGLVTDFSEAGYPQVDHVAVAWLERVDGKIFDPLGVRDKHIEERK